MLAQPALGVSQARDRASRSPGRTWARNRRRAVSRFRGRPKLDSPALDQVQANILQPHVRNAAWCSSFWSPMAPVVARSSAI
jgi:hypothetical protein